MRKVFLMFVCCAGLAAADGIPEADGGGGGTAESNTTVAGTPTVQLKLYGGTRTLLGDERPYDLRLIYSNGGSDRAFGDKFAEARGSGGLGIIGESSIEMPLHIGIGFDLQFGTFFMLGGFLGGGYNLPVMTDMLWLQFKADLQYSFAYIGMGNVSAYSLRINGTTIYDPKLDVTTSFFILRPEVNAYYRVSNSALLVAGIGYQLPLLSSKVAFLFSGDDYNDKSVSERLKHDSPNVIFQLDGVRADKIKVAPNGITLNVAIAFEL